MTWLGDFPEDFTAVPVFFTTHAADGSPVAPLSAFETADVLIYKDGDATQKTSTNGLTMTSPFDSVTGLHRLLIDTSNDTGDSGFWTAGAHYTVVLSPDETVDGVSVLKVIGTFGLALAAEAMFARADGVEPGLSMRAFFRLAASALFGKASGMGTTTAVFRDTGDTKDRITATVDADGNRAAVTRDAT